MQIDSSIVAVLTGVKSHQVPSCEKGFHTAPRLLDVEWPQEGAFMSIKPLQPTSDLVARC